MSEAPGIAAGRAGSQRTGLRLTSKLQTLRSCVKRQLPRKGDPCFCDIEYLPRIWETVQEEVIHIYLIEPGSYMKHHFCLTYDECQGLIQEIRKKSDQMEKYIDVMVGRCTCCGAEVCVDESYYVLALGELIHGSCIMRLAQSAPNRVSFPGSMQKLMDPSL